jgi:hypothetical protein|tara:strand:- start:80 stop:484 length:405 start_codon:yes stop_codon:yes gene_type:complete
MTVPFATNWCIIEQGIRPVLTSRRGKNKKLQIVTNSRQTRHTLLTRRPHNGLKDGERHIVAAGVDRKTLRRQSSVFPLADLGGSLMWKKRLWKRYDRKMNADKRRQGWKRTGPPTGDLKPAAPKALKQAATTGR